MFYLELIKLTVLWRPLGGVAAPVAPVTEALSVVFAANLSDVNSVWPKVLESEGLNVLGSVHMRHLKDIINKYNLN